MTTPHDLGFLPHDAGAARPHDLERQPKAPAPTAAAAKAWPQEDPTVGDFHYIGAALTPAEFRQYCLDYDFGSSPPSFWVWHHTYNPDASWAPASSNQSTWWDRNEGGMSLEQKKAKRKPQLDAIMRYYRDSRGWNVGPHLFIDDLFVWLFTPMYYVGIHANEGNSYHTSSGALRYSIGCEVIGAYDTVSWPPPIRAMCGWASACVKARLHIENTYTAAGQDQPWIHDPELSGHRDYTTEKTCPGLAITNDFFVQAAIDGWSAYQANTPPGPQPPDPLRARTIAGPPNERAYYCSVETANLYAARGGFPVLGYGRRDEFKTTDRQGNAATVFETDRAAIKNGREFALLSEVCEKGWFVP